MVVPMVVITIVVLVLVVLVVLVMEAEEAGVLGWMEMGMLGWCYKFCEFWVLEGLRDSGHGRVMLGWVMLL